MKHPFIPLVLVALAACGEPGKQATSASGAPTEPASDTMSSGYDAYQEVCAGCHEKGIDGAPRTGDRDAWAQRSPLWEAVLFEHAKDGYLEMPAKGGADTLSDPTVSRAAEYMLSVTYPELPTN